MAYASITYTSASGTTFALTNSSGDPIEYLRQNDISVTVNGVLKTLTTDYTFNTAGTAIVLNTAVSGATVVIARTTDIADATVSFTAGSTLTAQDLNNSDKQNRFALQEFSDTYGALTTGTGDLSALDGFIGSAETWVSDNAHAPTTGAVDSRVDSKIDTALTTDVVAGDSITVTDNSPSSGQITIGVTNASISTAKLVDSSVTTAKIADGNVTTAKILDANVTTAKILDANVTTAKIADNAVTSAKIADGTIVAADLASDSVTTAKILDSNVTTGKINDLAVTTAKLADSSVTSAKIVDGTIVAGDLASDSVTTAKIVDSNVTTAKINDSAVTTGKIADSAVTAIKIADGVITSAKLNAATVVTAAEQAACTPDDVTFFTTSASDGRYVNVTGDSMTGALAMGSNKITGLGAPTANADAATKQYVDTSVAAGVGDADYGDITVSGTGTVWTIDSGVVTSAKIADGTIVDGDINAAAAIDKTKISGTAITAADTGTVTSTMIADGTILNADVNAAAAIAGTKITPDFGSQNVTTTGTVTGASFIPSSSTAPTNGVYLPAANTVGISTGGSGRLFVGSTGNVGVGIASPALALEVNGQIRSTAAINAGDGASNSASIRFWNANTGLYHPGSDALGFVISGTEKARFDSSGRLGIGSSTPGALLEVKSADQNPNIFRLYNASNTPTSWGIDFYRDTDSGNNLSVAEIKAVRTGGNPSELKFGTSSTPGTVVERMRIDSSGRVGIGTTSPSGANLVIDTESNSGSGIRLIGKSANDGSEIDFYADNNSTRLGYIEYNNTSTTLNSETNVPVRFFQNGGEAFRVDTSKRLLVGTSTARTDFASSTATPRIQQEATDYNGSSLSLVRNSNNGGNGELIFGKSRGTSLGGVTVVAADDTLGGIRFDGADGTDFATGALISAQVDGTPGNNDMPGRLVFSTTADGASSPTERMRITNIGDLTNKTSNIGSITGTGFTLGASGYFVVTRSADCPVFINRETNDGNLIEFRQDGATEGNINVSGTTVALAGAHLSRWSQLPSGVERTEILRGSVLSNIDEMCEWGDEENEQLNRMKVSDVEGDKNVSGVFQAWDDDDDTYTNDFYCAMTGDFIIRVAEGVTVERGDLLMSAGDGTAKPQDDDIIRSKTIAKVTSTNVSCTYDDGSYCVPCVLMAC